MAMGGVDTESLGLEDSLFGVGGAVDHPSPLWKSWPRRIPFSGLGPNIKLSPEESWRCTLDVVGRKYDRFVLQ